jgi:hypothetical protein
MEPIMGEDRKRVVSTFLPGRNSWDRPVGHEKYIYWYWLSSAISSILISETITMDQVSLYTHNTDLTVTDYLKATQWNQLELGCVIP